MTLELPKDLQYSLLEFIAHVNSNNFDALPQDFVNLGATPAEKIDKVRDAGITDGFAFAMRQLSQGGGPKKIRERVRDEFRTRYGSELSDEELREKARADMLKQMETQLEKEGISVNGVNNVIETSKNRVYIYIHTYITWVQLTLLFLCSVEKESRTLQTAHVHAVYNPSVLYSGRNWTID